jgi:hypothetical protein
MEEYNLSSEGGYEKRQGLSKIIANTLYFTKAKAIFFIRKISRFGFRHTQTLPS